MKKNILAILLLLILFITLNILLASNKSNGPLSLLPKSNTTIKAEVKPTKKDYTQTTYEDIPNFSHLYSTFNEAMSNGAPLESLDEELYLQLTNFLDENIDNVGLVYYNLRTYKCIKVNENMDFVAASTYKVGLNLLYYYYANNSQIDLNSSLIYYTYNYQDGTGVISSYCYPGMEITIQKLLDLSIIYSDNIATDMLSANLGGYSDVRKQLYELLNVDYILSENFLTPLVATKILKYIYDNQHIPGFNHLIETMKHTIFHERLDKYIPSNMVAHKIGSIDSYAHDIGFVFTENPYIICIYTEDLSNADEVIASLSKIIYNNNTKNINHFKINEITYYKF